MFKSILVLESPWDSKSVLSQSVWPFVSEFARAINIKAFHQTFSDAASFCHWVRIYNKEKNPKPKLLYVAAHGNKGRIEGLKKGINGATISSALVKAKNIKYVHFGSCLYGNHDNLNELLKRAKHLSWAAGYDESVDWVDSTLFDVLFWGRIARRDEITKGSKSHTLAGTFFEEEVLGISKKLRFRFHYRYGETTKSLPNGSP